MQTLCKRDLARRDVSTSSAVQRTAIGIVASVRVSLEFKESIKFIAGRPVARLAGEGRISNAIVPRRGGFQRKVNFPRSVYLVRGGASPQQTMKPFTDGRGVKRIENRNF